MKMELNTNAAEELLKKVGDLSMISVFGPKVLIAIYVRSDKTAGGVYVPSSAKDEDLYQGKIGLVLKKGPTAFNDSAWFNQVVEVGDWVWFRASNGIAMKFNGVACRFIEDVLIAGTIARPDAIW